MSDVTERFIAKIDRLEARYAKDKYATSWLMPREMMLALRDELRRDQNLRDGIERFREIERNRRG